MSRFPKLTETFVLYEMVAVEEAGATVELFPLLREREAVVHPEAEAFVRRARYQPFVSVGIVAANVRSLRRAPRRYLGTWWAVLRGVWGSPNFVVGALGILPKTVRMAEEMVDLGVDHVHCHFANHPAVAGFVISRLTGIPFSFTAHGSDLHKERQMLPQKVEAAAFVCAVSRDNQRVIVEECGGRFADRVHVLHCGVDTTVFSPGTEADGGFEVLCVGTLHEVKGQRHLVDAVGHLRRRGVDVGVLFVGDGPDRPMLEKRAADEGVADLVRFAGLLPRGEVAARLSRTSAVVAPSVPTREGKREGIPVVLMEAMAAGRPVVSSRLSGIPELVEDGVSGLLTAPGDALAIADALERLASDPSLRRRLGDAARAKVQAEFDVRRSAARLLELIRAEERS
jgi:glycosyltransferase involved in cell wall biosynthesis